MESKRPIVSIVIPAYNAEKTLRKCVDSVLNQGNTPIEVIISDDGSKDSTWEIIQEYVQKDSRVRGISDTNGGLSCARNRGIRAASGQWVTFVDSDDYVEKGIFRTMSDVLTKHRPDMLDYQFAGDFNGTIYPAVQNHLPKDTLLDRSWITENITPVLVNVSDRKEFFIENYAWNKVFNLELIRQHSILFDESRRKWEDRLFSVTFLKHAQTYYSMSAYGYYYVHHGAQQSLSGAFDANIFRIVMDSYAKYRAMYETMYDFDGEYTVTYYCRLLTQLALDQFRFDLEPIQRRDLYQIFLEDRTVLRLFEQYHADTAEKQAVRRAVLSQDLDVLYETFQKQNELILKKQKRVQRLQALRQLLSRIKHKFFP